MGAWVPQAFCVSQRETLASASFLLKCRSQRSKYCPQVYPQAHYQLHHLVRPNAKLSNSN